MQKLKHVKNNWQRKSKTRSLSIAKQQRASLIGSPFLWSDEWCAFKVLRILMEVNHRANDCCTEGYLGDDDHES